MGKLWMISSRVIPYEKEHLPFLDLKDDGHFASIVTGDIKDRLNLLAYTGNGCTIIYEEALLGVMGFVELWRGVYEFWTMPCTHVDEHPIPYAKTVIKYLRRTMEDLPGHRFQIVAEADMRHNRWLKFLKFKHEGTFRKFSDKGSDFNMWARVI